MPETDAFREDGYHTYRIPGLIATKEGTLPAFCVGRKRGAGDSGDMDVLPKSSFNGGKSRQTARRIYEGPSAYSRLTALRGGDIGLLHERGEKSFYERITSARFSPAWLQSR